MYGSVRLYTNVPFDASMNDVFLGHGVNDIEDILQNNSTPIGNGEGYTLVQPFYSGQSEIILSPDTQYGFSTIKNATYAAVTVSSYFDSDTEATGSQTFYVFIDGVETFASNTKGHFPYIRLFVILDRWNTYIGKRFNSLEYAPAVVSPTLYDVTPEEAAFSDGLFVEQMTDHENENFGVWQKILLSPRVELAGNNARGTSGQGGKIEREEPLFNVKGKYPAAEDGAYSLLALVLCKSVEDTGGSDAIDLFAFPYVTNAQTKTALQVMQNAVSAQYTSGKYTYKFDVEVIKIWGIPVGLNMNDTLGLPPSNMRGPSWLFTTSRDVKYDGFYRIQSTYTTRTNPAYFNDLLLPKLSTEHAYRVTVGTLYNRIDVPVTFFDRNVTNILTELTLTAGGAPTIFLSVGEEKIDITDDFALNVVATNETGERTQKGMERGIKSLQAAAQIAAGVGSAAAGVVTGNPLATISGIGATVGGVGGLAQGLTRAPSAARALSASGDGETNIANNNGVTMRRGNDGNEEIIKTSIGRFGAHANGTTYNGLLSLRYITTGETREADMQNINFMYIRADVSRGSVVARGRDAESAASDDPMQILKTWSDSNVTATIVEYLARGVRIWSKKSAFVRADRDTLLYK